jgi:dTDP-4-dehydrorhamnose 3,5-epimerase
MWQWICDTYHRILASGVGVELSADNKKQLWVLPGVAHGFVVTSDSAEFLYKTTDYWYPEHERSLLWSDPAVGISGL